MERGIPRRSRARSSSGGIYEAILRLERCSLGTEVDSLCRMQEVIRHTQRYVSEVSTMTSKRYSVPAVLVVDIGVEKYGALEGNEEEDYETLIEIQHRLRVDWKENRRCGCMSEEDRATDRLPTCKCWREYIAIHSETKILRDRALMRSLRRLDRFKESLRDGSFEIGGAE